MQEAAAFTSGGDHLISLGWDDAIFLSCLGDASSSHCDNSVHFILKAVDLGQRDDRVKPSVPHVSLAAPAVNTRPTWRHHFPLLSPYLVSVTDSGDGLMYLTTMAFGGLSYLITGWSLTEGGILIPPPLLPSFSFIHSF